MTTHSEVVAFWRDAGAEPMVRARRRFRCDVPPALRSGPFRRLASRTRGLDGIRGRRARSADPARPVPAQLLPRQRAFLRHRWPCTTLRSAVPSRPASTWKSIAALRMFFYLPFEHSESMVDQDSAMELFGRDRRCGIDEVREAAPRPDRTFRPLPASQCGDGSRIDAGGNRLSGQRRVQRLTEANQYLAMLEPASSAQALVPPTML